MPFLRTRSSSTGDVRLEPDRDALGAAALARLLAHEGAAAGRQHRRAAGEEARHDAPLALAEMRLAIVGEDLGDA